MSLWKSIVVTGLGLAFSVQALAEKSQLTVYTALETDRSFTAAGILSCLLISAIRLSYSFKVVAHSEGMLSPQPARINPQKDTANNFFI